ncbi:MAG TPA: Ig-like domain-containing protein, partial [Actinomycetota bacterium]
MAVRRRIVTLGVLAVAALTAGIALAAWLTTGTGAGAATSGSLPQGATPTAVAADGDMTVSWSQNSVGGSFLGGQSGGGYVVTRYAQGSSTPVAPGSACSGTISGSTATLSCVEHSVPAGAWQYTVTPALGNWRGAESAESAAAGTPALAVTSPAAGTYGAAKWITGCSPAGICGTATDLSGAGLADVSVSIRQGAGNYWNGDAFGSSSEVLLPATGTSSWDLPFAAANFPADGTYTVRAAATDNHGDTSTTSVSFAFTSEVTPPTATIAFPGDGSSSRASTYNAGCATPGICGSAADATGVQGVSVSIRRSSDGTYWNGSAFSGSTETFDAATLGSPGAASTTWAYALSLPADGSYVVHVQTTDTAGNAETGTTYAATSTFSIDATAPTQSLSLTAATSAYLVSTTLYWNSTNTSTGSFQIVDTVTDSGSGPASAQF